MEKKEFLFGEGVIIRDGFYAGCTGVVVDRTADGRKYYVEGMAKTFMGLVEYTDWFDPECLEALNAPY